MKEGKKTTRTTSRVKKTQRLERQLRGAKVDAKGLRYEQRIANYFADKGWNPKTRIHKYGYEYDIYAEKKDILSGDEYLVVECKDQVRVSAKDVVRFINKVDTLYKRLPQILLSKPPVHAYVCHSGAVDKDAVAVAKAHKPSIKFLRKL